LHEREFNIIHPASGLKVDVIIAKKKPHDQSELNRARKVEGPKGASPFMVSAEDIILKKLYFYQIGQSDKHLRDIASILRVSGEKI
jgi:hypothetical protein